MSIQALKVWLDIDSSVIEECRLRIPLKQRPSFAAMIMVGQTLALGVIEPGSKGKRLGYSDKSIEQIIALNHGAVSYHQVRSALRALDQEPLFKTVRRSTRGENGKPGRAPRRVMYMYDPCNWIDHCVANPTLIDNESEWDSDPFSEGCNPDWSGAYHTPLLQPSFTNSYTYKSNSMRRQNTRSTTRQIRVEDEPF